MKTNKKITAIITSGGTSSRFGSNKLLEKFQNYTVIETTILKFINLADEIVIPTTAEVRDFLLKSEIYNDKIKLVSNGKTRQESVYNGLLNCNCDIVLIHDGARPYISDETIKEAIDLTIKHKAVVVGKMATDTIKVVKDGKIVSTLDRNTIFHAETPQCFEYKLIKAVHDKYKETPKFTDDSSMIEHENIFPHILLSKGNNKKITFREDLY